MPRAKPKHKNNEKAVHIQIPDKADLINVESPDSSLCNSDSDDCVTDLVRTQADLTPEFINELSKQHENESDISSDPPEYCVPGCLHNRKQGDAAMSRCCLCMVWYHLPCLPHEDEEMGESFWTCPKCRFLPSQVKTLTDSMNSKLNNIYMKINDMYHLNTKLLSAVEKGNMENKLLRQQLNSLTKQIKSGKHCNCVKSLSPVTNISDHCKDEMSKNISRASTSILVSTSKSPSSSPKMEDPVVVLDSDTPNVSNVNIICDSIPRYLDKSMIANGCGLKTDILQQAPTINEAVDYIQDEVDPEAVTLIHTGTRNLRRDSATTIIARFERLEANIRHKKLNNIAISSVVYRNDDRSREKTTIVNNYIRIICERNKWCFIDNGNIDNLCLWKDGVHLNDVGKYRLAHNISSNISSFMKAKSFSHT